MKLFISAHAVFWFKRLLLITLGLPVLLFALMQAVALMGFDNLVFMPLLLLYFLFFYPVHLALGKIIKFGPIGFWQFLAAGLFYFVLSYLIATAVALRKKSAS